MCIYDALCILLGNFCLSQLENIFENLSHPTILHHNNRFWHYFTTQKHL